jgi:hypothetical protein
MTTSCTKLMLDCWPSQLEELGFVILLCNLNSDEHKTLRNLGHWYPAVIFLNLFVSLKWWISDGITYFYSWKNKSPCSLPFLECQNSLQTARNWIFYKLLNGWNVFPCCPKACPKEQKTTQFQRLSIKGLKALFIINPHGVDLIAFLNVGYLPRSG